MSKQLICCFVDLCRRMIIQQLILVSCCTKSLLYYFIVLKGQFLQTWLPLSYTPKAIDSIVFLKLAAGQIKRSKMNQKRIQKFFKAQEQLTKHQSSIYLIYQRKQQLQKMIRMTIVTKYFTRQYVTYTANIILCNCYMKEESSIDCKIHCFLFFVRKSRVLGPRRMEIEPLASHSK